MGGVLPRSAASLAAVSLVVVAGSTARAETLYVVTDLGLLDSLVLDVAGINASAQVVGSLVLPRTSVVRGFRSAPGEPINPATDELGAFGAFPAFSEAYAVNASGQAVGSADLGHDRYAFRTAPN